MFEQTLTQVGEVTVGITSRGDAFVHLEQMDRFPGHIFVSKRPQHLPWCVTTADGHYERAARGHGCPRLSRDDFGRLPGNRISIVKYFNSHNDPKLSRLLSDHLPAE